MNNDVARCGRCMLPLPRCLCADIPVVPTRITVLFIRHAAERHRSSNTVRPALLALPNASLVEHGTRGKATDLDSLIQPGAALLFPDGTELPADAPPPPQLVVVDGSWSQARHMVQRLSALHALPRVRLAAPRPGVARLRQPPRGDGMSTLEAVALALERWEGTGVSAPLLALHDELVRRLQPLRGR